MTKMEYFERLRKVLTGLPEADVKKTLDYYEELVADAQEEGRTEEESISGLPSPEDIAAELRPTPVKRKKLPWMKYVLVVLAGFAVWTMAQKFLWNRVVLPSVIGGQQKTAEESGTPGSDTFRLGGYELTSQTAVYKPAEVSDFDIDSSVLRVKLMAEERTDIEITWYDCEEWHSEAEFSDGMFSLEYSDYPEFKDSKTSFDGIIIRVPLDYKANYDIDTDLGGIKAASCTGDMDFSADLGNIDISDCTGDLTIVSDMGDISVSGCKSEVLDLDCSMGSISLEDTAGQSLNLSCDMGSVDLSGVDFQSLIIETDAGSVDGTLAGTRDDYTVTCNVDLGTSNVKSGGNGPRTLGIQCDLGEVTLNFKGQ